MKKFNKILVLGLAGVSVLMGGFILSGCDITDDKDKNQTEQNQDEQKVVSSIAINEATLPGYIIKGHFARTNITMTITYEDNSTKVIDVTESMFSETDKEKLNYVGHYNLTVNYGGKTATIYANVVDERYLLKEVVEANIDKDVTLSVGNNTMQIDADNKIIKYNDVDDGWEGYSWINNNVMYEYDSDNEEKCTKKLASEWVKESELYHTMMVFDVLNGTDNDGDTWTIESIEKDGLNYILTAIQGEYCQHKYYFNEDFMYMAEVMEDQESIIYNFNYSIVNLEVPANIKALESSTTIDVVERVEDLKSVMSKYLKSDFELVLNGESYAQYDKDSQVCSTTEDGKQVWMWLNGDYCYTHCDGELQLNKHNSSAWIDRLESYLFIKDTLTESGFEYAITITEDGRYYELTITTNDEEDAEYKYIFNNNEIVKIEVSYNGSVDTIATYVKKSITLEVPADIKALENSAQ